MERMNISTLLAGPAGDFGGVPAGGWAGEMSRRQRLVGIRDPSGERRLLFGVGEGPTEAVAEAKQERTCVQSSTAMGEQGSGELSLMGWEPAILDRSCKCSHTLVCQNRVPTILIRYSSGPRPVLRSYS